MLADADHFELETLAGIAQDRSLLRIAFRRLIVVAIEPGGLPRAKLWITEDARTDEALPPG
jgi:hypothetical protein